MRKLWGDVQEPGSRGSGRSEAEPRSRLAACAGHPRGRGGWGRASRAEQGRDGRPSEVRVYLPAQEAGFLDYRDNSLPWKLYKLPRCFHVSAKL